ncbi:MAG: replication-associated recombination protein A [Syntrophobacteraceae bacterium]
MVEQLSLFNKRPGDAGIPSAHAPLAERMRPVTIEEFVGQAHLLGEGKILDRLLRNRRFQSLIFWGPPGSGKTTLAKIIVGHSQAHLIYLSAVMAGTREIRAAVEEAKEVWVREKRRTWLFMDEVHRLNKAQQDTLLPHVENGTLLLLGATTENPSFEVIRPLLSRAQVLVLEPLGEEDLKVIIQRALKDEERGLGKYPARLTDEARDYLLAATGGDARVLLNSLEVAVLTTPQNEDGIRTVDLNAMREALHRHAVHYDKGGEEHFNLISALHKSVRGSDPDAALYWLARMLEAGEEPLYIARRLVRTASEDIGLADPLALIEATAAFQTFQLLGSPEGELALAQATVYLCLAPKSNSVYTAFGKARELAKKTGAMPVPLHIRNAPTGLMKGLGYGRNYRYPHDDPQGWVAETYVPDALVGTLFYNPTARGWEGKCREIFLARRKRVATMQSHEENRRKETKEDA